MSAIVTLYSWKGLSIAHVANYAEQQSFPSLTMLRQPYLARASITATTAFAQATTSALSPEHTRLLQVQVEPGKRVRYEVTPNGQTARVADDQSPAIEGSELIDFGSGWTISIIEAA
jgi:hypothetical protein